MNNKIYSIQYNSGLDSSSSAYTIRLLHDLAREGRTIVCTIHQPSASVYEMFDHIYVLAEGQCVYQGSADNTVPYLSSIGLNCPKYHSAADYCKLQIQYFVIAMGKKNNLNRFSPPYPIFSLCSVGSSKL